MESSSGSSNGTEDGGALDAAALSSFHDRQLLARDWPVLSHPPARSGVWAWIGANHRYNQKRNDAVEDIDERQDLAFCLDALLAEARTGQASFKVYRQFKMVNDPALNPCLNGQAQGGRAAS